MESSMRAALVLCVFLVSSLHSATAAVVTVGDSLGWTNFDLSTQRVPDYASWAASQPVHSGDSLVFKFVPGFHNVVSLPTKMDFEACNMSKATVLDNGSSGNFTWKAPQKAGVYYFACGFSVEGQGTHCDGGQKVSITVIAAETPAPAVSPAPSSTSPEVSPVAPPTLVPVTSPPVSQGKVPASQASPGGSGSASAQAPGAAAANDKSSATASILTCWTWLVVIATITAGRL